MARLAAGSAGNRRRTVLALLGVLLGALFLWTQYASERERALHAARTWAASSLPATALRRSHVELQPTLHGWRAVFRGVDVPCAQTEWGCYHSDGTPPLGDEMPVFRDVFVCVEYGTGRGYRIAGSIRPVSAIAVTGCRRGAVDTRRRPTSPDAGATG